MINQFIFIPYYLCTNDHLCTVYQTRKWISYPMKKGDKKIM